jgi:hypothetical protein
MLRLLLAPRYSLDPPFAVGAASVTAYSLSPSYWSEGTALDLNDGSSPDLKLSLAWTVKSTISLAARHIRCSSRQSSRDS